MIETLLDEFKVPALARSYNVLHDIHDLRRIISFVYDWCELEKLSKPNLHDLVNKILIKKYKGETTLKAKLVEQFVNQKVTAAFEIRVNKSRADFLTINGHSKSFEIKSELDNLYRLRKQVSDYEKVFDYNFIVIDEKHYAKAISIIPARYGVIVLRGTKLTQDRKGALNNRHDVKRQISLFTKQEFKQSFKIDGITEDEVIINFSDQEINTIFKEMLKKRYAKRWSFLVSNASHINAIDYQFFFSHNVDPRLIYGHY